LHGQVALAGRQRWQMFRCLSTPAPQTATLVHPRVVVLAEGIEALAHTRVVIRPSGKMADQGYVANYKVGCC
jgi:hypothetical protein